MNTAELGTLGKHHRENERSLEASRNISKNSRSSNSQSSLLAPTPGPKYLTSIRLRCLKSKEPDSLNSHTVE